MIRLEITDPSTGTIFVPHLPATTSFDMMRENPLFNRRGDYTYDIDIPLSDAWNRSIYQHIDRIGASSHPEGRRARLLCDGHVIADGKELILKKEGNILKIQIISGNSELNYLVADSDLNIRDMNFGTLDTPTREAAASSSMHVYPDVNVVYPMLIQSISDEDESVMSPEEYAAWRLQVYANICEYSTSSNRMEYEDGTDLKPAPYLLYIVERFIELLGYSVVTDELRSEARWCRLVLIPESDTLDIAKMLPDWTADEFLRELETFFNCVFLVDPTTKNVTIKRYQSFVSENNPVEISDEDVVDDFERDYQTEEPEFLHEYEGLEYSLPDGEYWRKMSMDPSVERLCTEATASFAQVGEKQGEGMSVEQTNWKIFKLPERDVHFVRINGFVPGVSQWHSYNVYKRYFVNQFKKYEGENSKTLNIVPVRTELRYYSPARIFPVAEKVEEQDKMYFAEAISSRISENVADRLQVCFYTSDGYAFGVDSDRQLHMYNFRTAICVTAQDYLEDLTQGVPVHIPDYTGRTDLTLELNGSHGLVATHFSKNLSVEMAEASTLRFRSGEFLDPAVPYLIHGRLFLCQKLKYTYLDGHQHPIVEGTFFPYI